jgi:hypothetical protein
MDWLDLTIRYLGIALLSVILLALIGGALLCIAVVVIRFTPRLHMGKPQNDGELSFYDSRMIVTGKNGKPVSGERRLISEPLKIRWWLGLSRRNSSKWFIGLIRWEPKAD